MNLPRHLGSHPETGKTVAVSIGRFGPYVVHDGDFRSLDASLLFTVTLDEALALLAQPKGKRAGKKLLRTLREKTEQEVAVELYEGRYGPYVTDGSVNASLPKTVSADEVTLETALVMLQEAASKKDTRKPRAKKAAAKKTPAKKTPAKKTTKARKGGGS